MFTSDPTPSIALMKSEITMYWLGNECYLSQMQNIAHYTVLIKTRYAFKYLRDIVVPSSYKIMKEIT